MAKTYREIHAKLVKIAQDELAIAQGEVSPNSEAGPQEVVDELVEVIDDLEKVVDVIPAEPSQESADEIGAEPPEINEDPAAAVPPSPEEEKLAKIRYAQAPVEQEDFPKLKDIKINPQDGRTIADGFDKLKHDPGNPQVKASYDALINETNQQFEELINGGLDVTPNAQGSTGYKTSADMHKDITENNHLSFFPTEKGFGASAVPKDHPMLRPSGFKAGDKELLANDVFRVVHDVNGHNKGEPSGFGPKGEQQAFLTHRQQYSELAGKALFTETAGQNNWVNFSKEFGDSNRADPKNTIFSAQKAGLFPNSIIKGEWHK